MRASANAEPAAAQVLYRADAGSGQPGAVQRIMHAGSVTAIETSDDKTRLDRAVRSVYDGSLEDFVRRRDALAKELRSTGERASAASVKRLRKPSRIAWALNLGTLEGPEAIAALVTAVAETLDAQAGGGDVRTALARLRGAVREFASHAADAAARGGHRVEPGVLANAVLAVLGRPESFEQLRGGTLADVPEAGGLDFLARLPPPTRWPSVEAPPRVTADPAERSEAEAAVQEAARRAAKELADARVRWESTQQALREAESKLAAAEAGLRMAEEEARAARATHKSVQQEAEAAATQLRQAEIAAAETERRLI